MPVRNKSLGIDCQYVPVSFPEPRDAWVLQIMNLEIGLFWCYNHISDNAVHLADQEGGAPRLGCEHRVRGAAEEGDVEVQEVLELLARGCHHQQGHQVCDGDHGVTRDTRDTRDRWGYVESLAVTEARPSLDPRPQLWLGSLMLWFY